MSLQSFSPWGASTTYIRARRNASTVTFNIDATQPLYERDDYPMQRPATIGAGIWVDVAAAVT